MSYAASGIKMLIPRMGSGPAVFYYSTTDAHTDVDAAAYFTDGEAYGMKENDIVFVVDTDTDTCTLHHVTEITAAGAATIGAATLA